jgi:glycosyltransferase involved in cell wall biosynthesis
VLLSFTPDASSFQKTFGERKVALVHYWLVGMRGGEKVLEALCELFPEADIFTLVADPEKLSPTILKHKITTTFLQKIGGKRHYQKLLPLMPFALESLDLTAYDLVISSEAGPAKGVITRPDSVHICYCHSPMRYIWDLYPQYRESAGLLTRLMMSLSAPVLRQWDVTTSNRVDHFVANSRYVAQRIKKFYRRDAVVINPPVDLARFVRSPRTDDVYLCAGQITPYKKIELAIDAFNRMGKRLDIVGGGATAKMKAQAGPTVRFLGTLGDTELAERFAQCKALIFPGVEDFGIIPLEVMASGRPVIAFARGGAVETVLDGKTGLLFAEQTAESLMDAVARFEAGAVCGTESDFDKHVAAFSKQRFKNQMIDFMTSVLEA